MEVGHFFASVRCFLQPCADIFGHIFGFWSFLRILFPISPNLTLSWSTPFTYLLVCESVPSYPTARLHNLTPSAVLHLLPDGSSAHQPHLIRLSVCTILPPLCRSTPSCPTARLPIYSLARLPRYPLCCIFPDSSSSASLINGSRMRTFVPSPSLLSILTPYDSPYNNLIRLSTLWMPMPVNS